jgi:hypothetical protein
VASGTEIRVKRPRERAKLIHDISCVFANGLDKQKYASIPDACEMTFTGVVDYCLARTLDFGESRA